jgi:hypothetical protein
VADRSFEERKLIALETIAGAARLWIVSIARLLDKTSSADFLSSSSTNRTRKRRRRRRMMMMMMRGKRMTRKIEETELCLFRTRLLLVKGKDHDHRE